MTSDTNANNPGNPGFNAPEFTIENASWPGVATCTAAANITISSPAAANNPFYRIRNVSCKNTSPFMFPDSDFGFPGQSTVSNHDFKARRYSSNQGTAVANGDISITGWGTGAAVSNTAGFDQAFTFTVTAGTSPSANPTFSLTYKDGTWTNIPVAACKMVGGTGTLTTLSGEQAGSATILGPVVFNGTPVNASTYIINCQEFGK